MPALRSTLDPKLDVVFSLLFGAERNRDILLAFLNAVLQPASAIIGAELLPERPERQDVDEKGIVLDLRLRLADGEQVDVEMQNQARPAVRKRALYYWARLYVGGHSKGVRYEHLRRCVVIFIANFRMLESSQYHSIFRSTEITTGELLTEDHELHVLELPKLHEQLAANHERPDVLWGKFLNAQSDTELEHLAMQEPMLKRAKEALEDLSADPDARLIAERRETALRMYQMELAESEAIGEARGEARGELKGLAKAVLTVLRARGLDVPGELEQRVLSTEDAATLERWVERASAVSAADEILE